MEKEIKFRAWNGKEMYEPIIAFGNVFRDFRALEDGRITGDPIMQFTGLKDKNEKEIYEGDIVEGTTTRFTPSSYTGSNPLRRLFYGNVEYGTAGFLVKILNQRQIDKLGGKSVLHFSIMDEYEIIGNIHENPELLNP